MHGRRPLAAAPFPKPGEHPAGYLRRLALANGFGTMRQFRIATGIGALTPRSGPVIGDRLAEATGMGEEKLSPLSWTDIDRERAGERWLVVEGIPIRLQDLEMQRLRHCPACVAEGRPIPAIAAIRVVTACDRHGLRLLDGCATCGRPTEVDHRAHPFACGTCATQMADGARLAATNAELALTMSIARSMGHRPRGDHPVPSPFQTLAPGMLVAALGRLADLADAVDATTASTGDMHDRSDDSGIAADRCRATSAHQMLSSWPKRLISLIPVMTTPSNDIDVPDGRGGVAARIDTPVGRLALLPIRDHEGRPTLLIAEPVIEALSSQGCLPRSRAPGARATRGAVSPRRPSAPISHAEAMMRLEGRPEERRARWWVNAGLLGEQPGRGGGVTLLRRDVTRAERRLVRITAAGGMVHGHGHGDCDLAWIDRRVACGRSYGKSRFLHDLMAGRIPCRRVDDSPGLAGMRYDRHAIERLAAATKLVRWRATGHHASLSAFNAVARAIWGQAGVLAMADCDRLAGQGRTVPRRYDPPTANARPQKRWNTADLAGLAAERAGAACCDEGKEGSS